MKRTRTRTEQKRAPAELPDVRDGLTRLERVILVTLQKLTAERQGRHVSAFELYGQVVEQLDVSQAEFHRVLTRLAGRGVPGR